MAKPKKSTNLSKKQPLDSRLRGNDNTKPDLSSAVEVQNPRHIYGLYMYELSALTSDNIKHYLESSRRGLNFFKGIIIDEVFRRDLHFGGLRQTRKLVVGNKQGKFIYAEESLTPKTQQAEILKFLNENFQDRIDTQNLILDNTEAQLQGVTLWEINYDTYNSKWYFKNLKRIPNHQLLFDDKNNIYQFLNLESLDVTKLRSITWNTTVDRVDMYGMNLIVPDVHPAKILLTKGIDGNAQNGFLNGCQDALIWAWFFKNYGIKDWADFNETFANPSVIIKRPTIMGKEDISKLEQMVQNFNRKFKGLFPDGVSVELLENKSLNSTTNLFHEYINYFDTAASIRVKGQNLTTNIGKDGSRAAAQVHEMVSRDIEVADMLSAKNTINRLARRILDMNYFNLPDYPSWTFEEEDDVEFKLTRSAIFKNLRDTGWKVSQKNVEDEFDVKVEADSTATTVRVNEDTSIPKPGDAKFVDEYIRKYFEGVK